jgi:hypothetical protein
MRRAYAGWRNRFSTAGESNLADNLWMLLTKKRLKNPSPPRIVLQAAFFSRLTLDHLARCAAAILRRAEADIVRFLETSAMPLALAQRAF